jgi:hypothetical protein
VLSFSSGAARAAAPEGGAVLLTILEFAGSAIVGIFYVTILVALATRKKAVPVAANEEAAPHLDPAS